MANLLSTGAAWLSDQRAAHAASTVVYERGTSRCEIAATVGTTAFDVEDSTGMQQRVESRDYLVKASALLFDGAPVTPARGDLVRETVGAKVLVYEVLAPAGEPVFRGSDPFGNDLRIHTKLIRTEDAL